MRKSKKAPQILLQKADTNPVSNSPAQIGTMCAPGIDTNSELANLADIIARMKERNSALHIFATIQLEGALRVTELLNARAGDIDEMGRIRIKGLKGSNDRLVSCGQLKEDLLYFRSKNMVPWALWNRFYVYREYKKAGIVLEVKGNIKQSVTHALRHASAKVAAPEAQHLESAKALLGHKSLENTEHYVDQTSTSIHNKRRKAGSNGTAKGSNSDTKE